MPLETTRFDIQDYLKTPEQQAAYLDAALEDGDPAFIATALGDVARARRMPQIAKDIGMSRESPYKALNEKVNPEFGTVLRVMKALGLKLAAKPA